MGLLEKTIGRGSAVLTGLALMAAAAGAAEAAETQVTLRCAPFGSIFYVLGNAIQDLTGKDLPGIDVINAEGPGSTAVTVQMLRNKEWKDVLGCTSLLDYAYAKRGVKPFFDEPVPDIDQKIKVLFNGFYGAIGILTLDPNIKKAQDLAGKKLALGKRSQAHWGGLPAMFFETGLPNVNVNMDFMGNALAHRALAEGRVDAIISQIVVSPDGSKAFKPGVVTQLFASGRDIYAVGFDDDAFARAKKAGASFRPFKIDRKMLPETASKEAVNWVFAPAGLSVHKDFSEEAAYKITKFMIDNAAKLPKYHAMLNVIATPQGLLGDWTANDLHPGAARAYREAGVLK